MEHIDAICKHLQVKPDELQVWENEDNEYQSYTRIGNDRIEYYVFDEEENEVYVPFLWADLQEKIEDFYIYKN